MSGTDIRVYRGRIIKFEVTVPNEPTGMSLAFQVQRDLPLPPDDPTSDPLPVVYLRYAHENALPMAGFVCFACGFGWTVAVDVLGHSGIVTDIRRIQGD